ncbi:MAG TPA: hypothetical protein VFN06_04965, partial [Gaiellaceae bacterium]|nr:hypothetical protein [Gaiellaceae bacterium]
RNLGFGDLDLSGRNAGLVALAHRTSDGLLDAQAKRVGWRGGADITRLRPQVGRSRGDRCNSEKKTA